MSNKKQTRIDFQEEGSAAKSWNAVVGDFLKGETIKEARVADGCIILFFESGRTASFEGRKEWTDCECCGEQRDRAVIWNSIASPPASVLD